MARVVVLVVAAAVVAACRALVPIRRSHRAPRVRRSATDVDAEWAAFKRSRGLVNETSPRPPPGTDGEEGDEAPGTSKTGAEEEEEVFPIARPPKLGRARWTSPNQPPPSGGGGDEAATSAARREPFARRREVRAGRDVPPAARTPYREEFGLVNRAADPRTFASVGAVVAFAFVLYVYAFLSGGINDGASRYLDDTVGGDDNVAMPMMPFDGPSSERVWI